jgi:Tol biopolymer transport system component
VAYVTFPEGILLKTNRDGSHPVQLTDAPWHPLNPRWSLDGPRFCFSNVIGRGTCEATSFLPRAVHLGPFSRKIARDRAIRIGLLTDTRLSFLCWKYQVNNQVSSTYGFSTLPATPSRHSLGREGVWSPRWSPNGRFIAGLNGDARGMKIFDFETQRWSEVQRMGACSFPTWSSDSQFIYFVLTGADRGVFRVRVSGGNAERVVDLKGFRPTGAFGLWMSLDPTDTPMLIRDVGTDDIYALTVEQK